MLVKALYTRLKNPPIQGQIGRYRLGVPNTTVSGTYGQITGDHATTGASTESAGIAAAEFSSLQ